MTSRDCVHVEHFSDQTPLHAVHLVLTSLCDCCQPLGVAHRPVHTQSVSSLPCHLSATGALRCDVSLRLHCQRRLSDARPVLSQHPTPLP